MGVTQLTPNTFNAGLTWENPPVTPPTNEQLPLHVFSTGGLCTPLPSGDVIYEFNKTPVVPGNRFIIKFYASDKVLGYVYEGGFTTDGTNPHKTYQKVYKNGILVQSQTITIGNPVHDIAPDEFIDFYTDGDSGQLFWYGPGANSINFTFNFEAFTKGLNFTDLSTAIEPLVPTETLAFSVLDAKVQLAQIVNFGDRIPADYNQEPAVSLCALPQTRSLSPPNTNACYTFESKQMGRYPDTLFPIGINATLTKM